MLDPTMMYSCARLRAPGHDARGGVARQARADLRASSSWAPTTTSRDRHRLGRLRRPRRRDARLPRDHDDDLARAARLRRRARARGRARATASPCCSRTTATSTARYDKLVSIEMIEAVGWRHFGTFFRSCSRLLAPDGAMLLQAITIDDRAYEVEKAGAQLHQHLHLPRRLPALAGGDRRATSRARPTCSTVAPRGHHAALRRDAAALARELPRARRAAARSSATTSASGGCGRCT